MAPSDPEFGGETYEPEKDKKRLSDQLRFVKHIMSNGKWRTLGEIAAVMLEKYDRIAGEASISARLRDLRKKDFGGYYVPRRRRPQSDGLNEYKVVEKGKETLFD